MKLSYDLTLEQVQKLIMTPELRQAIQLLQYNSLELNEYLEREIEQNPMLETVHNDQEFENIEEYTKDKEIDWKEYIEKYDDISYKPQRDRNIKEYSYESYISYLPSLKEHLMFQLNLVRLEANELKIGENIIDNIDRNGYLITSVSEIAQFTKASVHDVENVLAVIHSFEPLGVGARDLRECLLIQIDELRIRNPHIKKVIEDYLEDVAHNRMQKIAKELNIDLIEVQEICDYIRKLEPKPGRCYSGNYDEVKYITPDAAIQLIDGEFIIILNDITGPRLNINSFYRELMRHGGDQSTTDFLTEKLNSAMWIIRSIEQRRMTIYKVIESILKFQLDFFKQGDKALRPLTLKDVADDIGVHESTVSRATNGKYVQTPRGLFELKYFFSSGISGNDGDISATSIKSTIKDLIDREDSKKPYSDQQIADLLKKKGIIISRRTVAKYRDELNIPSSSMRRRY